MRDCKEVTSDKQAGSTMQLEILGQSPYNHFLVVATARELSELGILPPPVYRDPPVDPAYLRDPPHFW